MRPITPALAAHLAEGATTLCRCWRLTRRDGTVLGFTDHDRDIAIGADLFRAGSGLEAHETSAELGFAIGGGEVAGALSSDAITEADIAAGLYDDAGVELLLVNWAKPSQHVVREVASIGEIRREDGAFVAELRGPMHRLDEERGLRFRATCSADLGDARCGIDLDDPAFHADGIVLSTDGATSLRASGLAGHAAGRFTAGRLLWTGGANAGLAGEVRDHGVSATMASLDLWQRAARIVAPGDTFRVTAGCDKRFSTCRDRFANVVRFRGFPHMPGNDFVVSIIAPGDPGLDGGSLFR